MSGWSMHIHLAIYIPKGWLFSLKELWERIRIWWKHLFSQYWWVCFHIWKNAPISQEFSAQYFSFVFIWKHYKLNVYQKGSLIYDVKVKHPRNSEAMPPCQCYLLLAWSRSKIRWISWAASPARRVILLRGSKSIQLNFKFQCQIIEEKISSLNSIGTIEL